MGFLSNLFGSWKEDSNGSETNIHKKRISVGRFSAKRYVDADAGVVVYELIMNGHASTDWVDYDDTGLGDDSVGRSSSKNIPQEEFANLYRGFDEGAQVVLYITGTLHTHCGISAIPLQKTDFVER